MEWETKFQGSWKYLVKEKRQENRMERPKTG